MLLKIKIKTVNWRIVSVTGKSIQSGARTFFLWGLLTYTGFLSRGRGGTRLMFGKFIKSIKRY